MTKQEEMFRRFDERLPQMLTDLVWTVTDGGVKIEPNRFLTYQEEPVHEFEQIKQYLQSEIDLALAERDEKTVGIIEGVKKEITAKEGVDIDSWSQTGKVVYYYLDKIINLITKTCK